MINDEHYCQRFLFHLDKVIKTNQTAVSFVPFATTFLSAFFVCWSSQEEPKSGRAGDHFRKSLLSARNSR
jgi:hypothetical protein